MTVKAPSSEKLIICAPLIQAGHLSYKSGATLCDMEQAAFKERIERIIEAAKPPLEAAKEARRFRALDQILCKAILCK